MIRHILFALGLIFSSTTVALAEGSLKATSSYDTALQQTQYNLGLPVTTKVADGFSLVNYVGVGETRDQFIHNKGFDSYVKFGAEIATSFHTFDVGLGASTMVFGGSQAPQDQVYASLARKLWN